MGESLRDRTAVSTGGASGIGASTAELFVSEGANVVIADLNDQKGEALAEKLGSACRFVHTDVSKEADVEAMLDFAVKSFGKLDVLYNNAGISGPMVPIRDVEIGDYRRAMDALLLSQFMGIKHAIPLMEGSGGAIVNTASIAGITVIRGGPVYALAKAASVQLTKYAALELAPLNIRVNAVLPGSIPTPIIANAMGLTGREAEDALEGLAKDMVTAQPMRRSGRPMDIAQGALYLASDAAAFVTGHTLVIDGGATLEISKVWSPGDYAEGQGPGEGAG